MASVIYRVVIPAILSIALSALNLSTVGTEIGEESYAFSAFNVAYVLMAAVVTLLTYKRRGMMYSLVASKYTRYTNKWLNNLKDAMAITAVAVGFACNCYTMAGYLEGAVVGLELWGLSIATIAVCGVIVVMHMGMFIYGAWHPVVRPAVDMAHALLKI